MTRYYQCTNMEIQCMLDSYQDSGMNLQNVQPKMTFIIKINFIKFLNVSSMIKLIFVIIITTYYCQNVHLGI